MFGKTKRIVTWPLLVMLFMGAVSFQPVAQTAIAAYKEQKAWQSILDADLQGDSNISLDEDIFDAPAPPSRRTNALETGEAIKTEYETELLMESEAYAADRYIVKYKNNGSVPIFNANVAQNAPGAARVESFDRIETKSGGRFAVVAIDEPVNISDFRQVMEAAEIGSNVEYIQPDYMMSMSANPTSGQPYAVNGAAASKAKGGTVIVALLDTGIDITHPGLAGQLYINQGEIPDNGADDDGNGYADDVCGWDFFNNDDSVNDADTYTDQWHGTHIAGIIAAQAPNAIILPIKTFEGGYAYTSDILNAIAYAESMGAAIINCSWGSRFENLALKEAIENSGCLFVCAAGNNLYNMDNYPVYPAAFSVELDNVISVASVDDSYKLSRFSNFGMNTVDITAPGENIQSLWLDGGYQSISGTSMSAGFVSSAAALVLARYSAYNAPDVKQRLIESADTVTGLADKIIDGKMLNTSYAASTTAGPNTNVIDAPDDEPLPVVIPNEEPEEDDYELYGAENNVTLRASMGTARHGLQAVALNGKLYAIGGQTAASANYTNLVERYDPETDTWTTMQGMNTARSYFGAVAYNGKIYVMGGIGTSGTLNSFESYDPVTNTWTTLNVTGMTARRSFTATLIPGTSHVYIVGGYTSSPQNTVYEYNIATGIITVKANLSNPISNHVALYMNDKLYIKGGITTGGVRSAIEYVYDISTGVTATNSSPNFYFNDAVLVPASDRVVVIGGVAVFSQNLYSANIANFIAAVSGFNLVYPNHLITARSGLGADILDGKIYIVGGRNSTGIIPTMEMMDLGWKEKAAPPVALTNYKTVSLNGKLYMIGGSQLVGGVSQNSNKVYEYDSAYDTWKTMNSTMPVYARYFSLTAAYGKIYMIGGQTATTVNGVFSVSKDIYEYDPQTDIWSTKNTISSARYDLSSVLFNGKIYITGGKNNSGQATATVQVYDPQTNTIIIQNNLPSARTEHYSCVLDNELCIFTNSSATYLKYDSSGNWSQLTASGPHPGDLPVVLDGALYVLSYSGISFTATTFFRFLQNANVWERYNAFNYYGLLQSVSELNNEAYIFTQNSQGYSTGLVTYTPPATAWTYKDFINESKYGSGAAVINDDIYLSGGASVVTVGNTSTAVYFTTLEKYDQNNDSWNVLKSMSNARGGLGLAAANGKLYAIGGSNTTGTLTFVEEYDPATNTWATKEPIPVATTDMAIASYNNLIYIFGGKNASGGIVNTVRIYNPTTNLWSTGTNMPAARIGARAAVIDGKIYVVGGFLSNGAVTNLLQIYDPANNTWDTSKASLPWPLAYAGVVASDSLYVIGGFDGTNEISMVFEYSPVLNEWLTWAGPNKVRYDFAAAITSKGIYAIGGGDISAIFNLVEFTALSNISNDYRHLGDDRINLTGNFSRTYTDLSYASQGFNIEFTRTYNSLNTRPSLISPGWTFGFQGKVESSGNDVIVYLPNGSGCAFKKNSDGSFTALDSRSALVKNTDGTYTLTTKDQYTYGFDSNGYMNWMKDKNGNQITITVNSTGQVTAVTDQVGRTTTISYTNNRISTITGPTDPTDPTGRVVTFAYDANNRLSSVKDPNGYFTYYTYHTTGDATGFLNTVKDNNNTVMESVTYLPKLGERLPRTGAVTDRYGNVRTYAYNDSDGKLTTTDSSGRVNITWYDKDVYPIRERDAEGKETRTQYKLDGGINRYGEVSVYTDRNGNSTYYERDAKGNIIRQVNHDGSMREYTYDSKNNLLSEKDELGKYTFYEYDDDDDGIKLTKTARPLNGTDIYSSGAVQSNFALTVYDYYTGAEALTQTGKTIHGLLKLSLTRN